MVVDRARAGWSRQLRLTPLRPAAYVAIKVLVAMVLGAVACRRLVVGAFAGGRDAGVRLVLRPGRLVGSLVFAAFGLFMGYLLPSENVMQFLGPVLALLAVRGGLFVPLDERAVFADIAKFTPVYGVGEIVRAPLTGDGVDGRPWSTWWLAGGLRRRARRGGSAGTPRGSEPFDGRPWRTGHNGGACSRGTRSAAGPTGTAGPAATACSSRPCGWSS